MGPLRSGADVPPAIARIGTFLYADTAMFGAAHAIRCCIEFFGVDRILFASDTPFDPEKGPGYIRSTIANLESLELSDEDRQKIYEGNARRVLGVT